MAKFIGGMGDNRNFFPASGEQLGHITLRLKGRPVCHVCISDTPFVPKQRRDNSFDPNSWGLRKPGKTYSKDLR